MSTYIYFIPFLLNLLSCTNKTSKYKEEETLVLYRITNFYDLKGNLTFSDSMRVIYKDSIAIEQVNRVNIVTDTDNITRISNIPMLYRYIDLKRKALYDYRNFSDTAKSFNKAFLPDSLMLDFGWSFYSEKGSQIHGTPEKMNDTLIENIIYKRAKFNFALDDLSKRFLIGYFRCDTKGAIFSLEKKYSREINCTLVKFLDFRYGFDRPFASKQIDFISDTLSQEELKIFDAWEKNAKNNPVRK